MGEGSQQPILAFVGAGRDGSTMLQRLLDGAPGIFMYPIEIKFANRFDAMVMRAAGGRPLPALDRAARRAGLRPGVAIARADSEAPGELLEQWTQRDQFDNLDENYFPTLEEPLRPPPHPGPYFDAARGYRLGEALRVFLESARHVYGAGEGSRLLSFKTIEVEHERRYAAALPDARFVHIVRDPLTQFSSTKRTVLEREGFLFHYPVGDLVTTFVKRYITHARAAGEALQREPERHLLVRYEDVLARPVEEVARICEWVGVEPPLEPEALTILGGLHASELPDNPSKPGVATPKQVVADTARTFGYAPVRTEREDALVRALCAGWARRLGYGYEDGALALADRVSLLARWARIEPWERDVLKRETGVRSFVRRRLVVLEAVLGHSPA